MLTLPFLLSFALGFALLRLLWPRTTERKGKALLFQVFLAAGVGLGISSCLFFLWLVVENAAGVRYFAVELAALVVLVGVNLYLKPPTPAPAAKESTLNAVPKTLLWRSARWLVFLAAALAVANALATFTLDVLKGPSGHWDAWAIWNMHARFLADTAGHWRDCFTPLMAWANADYPLLLPALIARGWTFQGEKTWLVPAGVAFVFGFATMGLTFAALQILRSRTLAALAVLLLACTPAYVDLASWQYADIPIGFFFLTSTVLCCFYDCVEQSPRYLWLAGLSAGLAAWTKNEGLAFIGCLALVRFLIYWPSLGWRASLRLAGEFAKGLAPILIIILYFKFAVAPPNYLLALNSSRSLFQNITDGWRYGLIFSAYKNLIYGFGSWSLNVWLLFLSYVVIIGGDIHPARRKAALTALSVPVFLMAMYTLVYLNTPFDLAWHLGTSVRRLFCQLWPSALFAVCMLARTPEDAVARSAPAPVARGKRKGKKAASAHQ